jgi:Fusaric acid resistance protein family
MMHINPTYWRHAGTAINFQLEMNFYNRSTNRKEIAYVDYHQKPRKAGQAARARFRTYGFPFAARKRLESFGEMLSDAFRRRMRIPEIDYKAWSYALRSASAASLALYISLSLNLDESGWAFATCYIVGAQRLSGQILARSVARVIGTVVGATASFVLVNAFAQERVLFIGCLAAWLSVCAFFSHYQRRSLGICVGPIWLHDGHRRYTGGINAGFCIRRDLEPGGKHHHRHSLYGYGEHDRIS